MSYCHFSVHGVTTPLEVLLAKIQQRGRSSQENGSQRRAGDFADRAQGCFFSEDACRPLESRRVWLTVSGRERSGLLIVGTLRDRPDNTLNAYDIKVTLGILRCAASKYGVIKINARRRRADQRMLTGKGGTERSGIFFSGQVSVGAYIYHAIRDSL